MSAHGASIPNHVAPVSLPSNRRIFHRPGNLTTGIPYMSFPLCPGSGLQWVHDNGGQNGKERFNKRGGNYHPSKSAITYLSRPTKRNRGHYRSDDLPPFPSNKKNSDGIGWTGTGETNNEFMIYDLCNGLYKSCHLIYITYINTCPTLAKARG